MKLIFTIPSKDEVLATCIPITESKQLKNGTLGTYGDAQCIHCSNKHCLGHVGYIQLSTYIPHPLFFDLIPKVLSHVGSTKYEFYHKYDTVKKEFKVDKHCTEFQFKYREGIHSNIVSVKQAQEMLKQTSSMGFAESFDPKNLLVDYVLVMPNVTRSNLSYDGNLDTYTRYYEEILQLSKTKMSVRICNLYMELLGKSSDYEGTPMIQHILTSKSGLMRSNLMCSRQDRSARSVISTDSMIPLSHIGVPKIFRDKLTVYEYIDKDTDLNEYIKYMKSKEFVNYGNLPIKTKLEKHLAKYCNGQYYTERRLRDDDWVYINRQPTLHRHSIIAFKVKLVDVRTIVLNLACVPAFNADFDGDEVTMYVASDKYSIKDCETKLAVHHNIVSPENGSIVIGPVQDCISGTYCMTRYNQKLPKELVYKMGEYLGEKLTCNTSREVFLHLVPLKNLSVEDGVNKAQLYSIIKTVRGMEAIEFITKLQVIVDLYLKVYPLSVCYKDFNPLSLETVQSILDNRYRVFVDTINHAEETKINVPVYAQQIETQICHFLDGTVKNGIMEDIMSFGYKSDLMDIIESGAKGKKPDLVQSWVALCQQYVSGRQEPMFGLDESVSGPEQRGFVISSYGRGLDEAGLFYQATAARSTVVSTGVNTADPGYLQRQLSKFMADVYVDDKMNVVNHEGVVIKL